MQDKPKHITGSTPAPDRPAFRERPTLFAEESTDADPASDLVVCARVRVALFSPPAITPAMLRARYRRTAAREFAHCEQLPSSDLQARRDVAAFILDARAAA